MGHRSCPAGGARLLEAGFTRAVRAAYLQSEDRDVVLDNTTPDREPLSMYIEGVR